MRLLPGAIAQCAIQVEILCHARGSHDRKRHRAREELASIVEVNLAQYRSGQTDAADLPIALNRRHVFPVPVLRLQPAPFFGVKVFRIRIGWRRFFAAGTKRQAIVDLKIGREEDAVLVLDKEPPYFIGIVPSNFRNAGGQVRHHVRISAQGFVHPIQLFRIVGKMDADECGPGMPRNHAIERFENLFPRRKFVRVAEPPASMVF